MSTQMRKIISFENDTLKVEYVQKTFENLNSFELTLKMLKTMSTYQEHIFRGFFFFAFCYCFGFLKTWGQKLGSNNLYTSHS